MSVYHRVATLSAPFLIAPLLGFLIAENYLGFGGGDKDIAILIPWVLWALIFLLTGIFQWKKYRQYRPWLLKSLISSLIILIAIWLLLFIYSIGSTRLIST